MFDRYPLELEGVQSVICKQKDQYWHCELWGQPEPKGFGKVDVPLLAKTISNEVRLRGLDIDMDKDEVGAGCCQNMKCRLKKFRIDDTSILECIGNL